jgi:predicted transposase/invertase (TIGR01784 family)
MYMPNLMNDFAFKYVFGADDIYSNNALKGMLETFLERRIESVQLKNPEMTKDIENMKNPIFDILVRFDDSVQVDVEMQVFVDLDELKERTIYYCTRLHASQDLKGMPYSSADKSIVLSILNGNLFDDLDCFHTVNMYTDKGELFSDAIGLYFVELKKLKESKSNAELDNKEQLVYYFLNCQNKQTNSRIKEMVENNEVIQMIDERVDQIEEDRWKKLNDDFVAFHQNEREVRIKKAEDKAKAEGRAEGKAEGLAEGRTEGEKKIIQAFLKNMSIEDVALNLNKSISEIESILNS